MPKRNISIGNQYPPIISRRDHVERQNPLHGIIRE
jgi:hypothetical protein